MANIANTHKLFYDIHSNIKEGYDAYGLYFWITGISAIIGGFIGIAGIGAWILTIGIFYWVGKGHKHLKNKINK